MGDRPIDHMIIENPITLHPEDSVEHGMKMLKKHGIRTIPVVNDDGVFLGMFSSQEIIEHLVPLAGFLGESLEFAVGAAPDLAERLREFQPLKVEQFTEKNIYHIKPTTHTWEALRSLVKYGSPLPIVDDKDGHKFIGLISEQKAVESLLGFLK